MKTNRFSRARRLACALLVFLGTALSAQSLYWESPAPLTPEDKDCRFPCTVSSTGRRFKKSACFWQEVDKDKNQIYLAVTTSGDGQGWSEPVRFAGPFTYSGDIPEMYSVAVNSRGKIAVAVLSSINEISVYTSEDGGDTFTAEKLKRQRKPLVGPRIFATTNDNFIVFATLANETSFSMLYSFMKKGTEWSDFTAFPFSVPGTSNPLVPYMTPVKGGDLLVFQAYYESNRQNSFQIFSSLTKDNGSSWTAPVMVTGETANFWNYNNQRPVLLRDKNDVYLAWERSPASGIISSIYVSTLSPSGTMQSQGQQISTRNGAVNPVFFSYNDRNYLCWADAQTTNNRVYLSEKLSSFWSDPDIVAQGITAFQKPVISNQGKEISFIWQQRSATDKDRNYIAMLGKDSSAQPPAIHPVSYENNRGGTSDLVTATVETSEDSSGIQGFAWLWTDDFSAEPEEIVTNMPQESEIQGTATQDGPWYFKVKQMDYAGNWSASATSTYIRDTVAPHRPRMQELPLDDMGLLQSNTFSLSWLPDPDDDDVAGYTWALQYVAAIPRNLAVNARHPLRLSAASVENMTQSLLERNEPRIAAVDPPPRYLRAGAEETTLSEPFSNLRNGLYVFSVAAIDWVGNISEAATVPLIMNKYVPVTYITALSTDVNIFGDTSVDIFGGGFTYEGEITSVYIDADGKAPYDYVLTQADGDYTVPSDNRITGLVLTGLPEGTYRIGLTHSDRGLYMSKDPLLTIREYGTIKRFTDNPFIPQWVTDFLHARHHVHVTFILLAGILLFAAIAFVVTVRGLSGTAKEAMLVQAEVRALIEGDSMPQEKKKKSEMLRRKGVSLRFKLMLFTMTLMLILSIAIIVALGYIMIQREERTLVHGLEERVHVILDSISNGAKINLPNANSNLLALSDLTGESDALSDARYATITGYGSEGADTNIDYVWATNDQDIAARINTEGLVLGASRLVPDYLHDIDETCAALNASADAQITGMARQIAELTAEGVALASNADQESLDRLSEISEITTQLNNRVSRTLDEIADQGVGSYPAYNTERIDYDQTTYLFYKPVLYRHANEQTYVHGIVFVEITTQALINEMHEATMTIVKTAIAIIGIALLLSLLSAIALSGIIVKPINKLARHVAMIRDTDNKEALAGKDITIKSKDEIGMLGDTVNEMTHGLVEAAVQAKNLTFGKEVQTRFLPLQTDEKGNSLTTGSLHAGGADFFSYYAGADDLSGDYFDYKQLDADHFAVIKCDVSGHGVPAALIMVEVATLFLNAFNNWNVKNPAQGTKLGPVVGQINDLIESRGFKGRFAAFTLTLMNTKTGECWFCNAGDNIVQYYDGTAKKKKSVTLPETPAAGMFSTDLVDMKGGYRTVKLTLKKNDVLFLYTDGIEEAKRLFRDKDCQPITCQESGLHEGEAHGNHVVGEESEEMTPERVTDIIETVNARGTYTLRKWHTPDPDEELTFDFSACEGTAEESIMALVSIEKVFRMYKPASPKPNDRVKVDKKIDEFLRRHFRDYDMYCMERSEIETDSSHIYYHGVLEDPQYDDLTLIAIKKN